MNSQSQCHTGEEIHSHVLEGKHSLLGRAEGWLAGLALFILGGQFSRERLERANSHSSERKKPGDLEECVRKSEKLGHVLKSKLEEAVFSKCMWAVDVANFFMGQKHHPEIKITDFFFLARQ